MKTQSSIAGYVGLLWLGVSVFFAVSYRVRQERKERAVIRFEMMKACGPKTAQTLVIGDSRSMRGILAEEIELVTGKSCLNFAFSACTYEPSYLQQVETLLMSSPDSSPRLIMGVSPWVFSIYKLGQQETLFKRVNKLNAIDRLILAEVWREPYPVKDVLAGGMLFEGTALGSALSPAPDNPPRPWPSRQVAYDNLPPQRHLFEETLTWIKNQIRRGVRVTIVRIPSDTQHSATEKRILETALPDIWNRLSSTGAQLLMPPADGWETIDGEHLSGRDAKRFTKLVLGEIR